MKHFIFCIQCKDIILIIQNFSDISINGNQRRPEQCARSVNLGEL